MDLDFVDLFENRLRKVEAELEDAGASICSVQDGAVSWNEINQALAHVRDAIRNAYRMRKFDI